MIGQLQQFISLRDANPVEHEPRGNFQLLSGTYSVGAISSFFSQKFEQFEISLEREVAVRDACALEPNSLNVIICDPPYGFNTTEEQGKLADLYGRFIRAAVAALRDEGHLIVCLPAESYTGRDLPYCTRASVIVNAVLIEAQRQGKEVYTPGRSMPARMLAPPYYWEAERALRRTILHFRVKTTTSPAVQRGTVNAAGISSSL